MMMSVVAEMTTVSLPPARSALTISGLRGQLLERGSRQDRGGGAGPLEVQTGDPGDLADIRPLQHDLNRLAVGVGLIDLLIDPGLDLVLADHVALRLTGQAGSGRADSDDGRDKTGQGQSLVRLHDMLLFVKLTGHAPGGRVPGCLRGAPSGRRRGDAPHADSAQVLQPTCRHGAVT